MIERFGSVLSKTRGQQATETLGRLVRKATGQLQQSASGVMQERVREGARLERGPVPELRFLVARGTCHLCKFGLTCHSIKL